MAPPHKMKGKGADGDQGPRTLVAGIPRYDRCDNKVTTSKYNLFSFIPVAVMEQFRRVANMYFLIIGCIMAIGWYTTAFESAISPFTTLGPLALVISISLLQEGLADLNRHRSDSNTNNAPCIVLNRTEDLEDDDEVEESIMGGRPVTVNLEKQYKIGPSQGGPATPAAKDPSKQIEVAYQRIKRMNIRQGHLVLVRNREMVPADMVLLASSGDNGNAYIETSSIDGETNLKLRGSPHLPKEVLEKNMEHSLKAIKEEEEEEIKKKVVRESLSTATKRIVRFSALAFPHGQSALENPNNPVQNETDDAPEVKVHGAGFNIMSRAGSAMHAMGGSSREVSRPTYGSGEKKFVAALKSEAPNASVNTFSGSLWLPPIAEDESSIIIPLNAENMLLRGAVLRNTEWAIGLSVFTGDDTKLVRNSFDTPSKFSQLDQLMNKTVLYILCIMVVCISVLASLHVSTNNREFDRLWYIGLNKDTTQPWPYLPDSIAPPQWETSTDNWVQTFFLFVTLLNNFVPLSLYVTVEIITAALRIFINLDIEMYHPETDTRTVARSTTVTDLGQVQYVFSDKTGTLTQNVMRFKRCSVDGNVFGAPVIKSNPDAPPSSTSVFHPLKRLLTGKITVATNLTKRQPSLGLEGLGESSPSESDAVSGPAKYLTFNSEMFLRVMALCHTVVVEKDYDSNKGVIESSNKVETPKRKGFLSLSSHGGTPKKKEKAPDEEAPVAVEEGPTAHSDGLGLEGMKGKDGAPKGFAYQAESPDEGALVEAASLKFNFQVVGRDSAGIKLLTESPSLLSHPTIIDGFKNGTLTSKAVAAETGSPSSQGLFAMPDEQASGLRKETWEVLAINKFDSTRKRMSILVRSPPELGGVPMLLCKGADTAMLDPSVIDGGSYLVTGDETEADIEMKSRDIPMPVSIVDRGRSVSVSHEEEEDWERSMLLGIQSHLSDFAREGLRTLVLGVRILSERESESWLSEFKEAASAIKNRDEKLTAAALKIERKLHIVGATAIEDKLQDAVPETIAKLGRAGIKLWVLTGDKRETAKEIGYATKVLTEKMRPGLIEVAKAPKDEVRTRMAMEFMKLVKYAKLPEYQRAALGSEGGKNVEKFLFQFGKCRRAVKRAFRRLYHKYIKTCWQYFLSEVDPEDPALTAIDEEEALEKEIMQVTERRKGVRDRAEKIVRDYRDQLAAEARAKGTAEPPEVEDLDLSMGGDPPPDVFSRGDSARAIMAKRRNQGKIPASDVRSLTLANVTAHDVAAGEFFVDEEVLSMKSIMPKDNIEGKEDYNSAKRTLLEMIFAADRSVRHGRLLKHLHKEKLQDIKEGKSLRPIVEDTEGPASLEGPRGLVIEGAALEMILGDAQLEELLFAVANTCDSVIACRVSPAQKAQLVQLVRRYVVPEPVTLAIGDGANDVGMIQEAHVGVGISGKEGQQAVNASDFSIAQFRFLEPLVLIHGRWNFLRQSTVVLFSFYKNAVMAGCLIVFSGENLFSGTPLFDEWIIAMLNFVAGVPIAALGFWDRNLDKDYIREHPEVYTPTRTNEVITMRYLVRWVVLTLVHIFTLYFLTIYPLAFDPAGGYTSAWDGLMGNKSRSYPGDGEGGDIKSVGLVTFTCMIFLLSYKVLYESRSIIIGRFPAFRCRKQEDGTTWLDRAAYTWIANGYLSIGFYFASIYIYNSLGRNGASGFSYFVDTVTHTLQFRTMSWILIILVPIAGMILDVVAKVYANLFFPTQNQIHVEIFVKGEDSKRIPASPYGLHA